MDWHKRDEKLDQLRDLVRDRIDRAGAAPVYKAFRDKLYGFARCEVADPPTTAEFAAAIEDLRNTNKRLKEAEAEVDAMLESLLGPDPAKAQAA